MPQTQKIGRGNTTVFKDNTDGMTKVILYSTPVVAFNGQKIVLDSGGWLTSTTKNRMNQTANQFALGFYVFQKKRQWFVKTPSGQTVEFKNKMEIPVVI